jgi:hypothetical protein
MYFDVSDLAYGSAVVELRERVQVSKRAKRHVVRSVVVSLSELVNEADSIERPFWATPQVLKKVRSLADPLPHASSAELGLANSRISIDEKFRERIDDLLSPDTESAGQLSGTLDAINMHGRRHAYIYPLIGHQKVVVDFSSQSDQDVKAALQRRVQVFGKLQRRAGDAFPYFVEAENISILEEDAQLPTLRQLRGSVAPMFAGSTVEFQRRMRNG